MNEVDIAERAQALEMAPAAEILAWASERFAGKLTFATGFGVEGCVIIDLAARNGIKVDLFTLDTGLLFPQTYELWKKLEAKYGVKIRAVTPERSVEEQGKDLGEKLWERDPDKCCNLRKVQPLKNALVGFDAWVSAIRRDQTRDRSDAKVVERDAKFDLIKVNPLVRWTNKDIWKHVYDFDVPYNPMHNEGYPSIGCWPCTTPVAPGEDPRAGRWRGLEKKECGLHAKEEPLPSKQEPTP